MDAAGQSGIQCSTLHPPTTYASPLGDILVRLVAFSMVYGVEETVGLRIE